MLEILVLIGHLRIFSKYVHDSTYDFIVQDNSTELEKLQRKLPNLPMLANWTHFKWIQNENLEESFQDGCAVRPQIINIQDIFLLN